MKKLAAVVALLSSIAGYAVCPCFAQAQTDTPKPPAVSVYDFATASPEQIVAPSELSTAVLTSDPSEEVDGKQSLKGDSRNSNAEWNEFFHSKQGVFQEKMAYEVSIDYKILARNPDTQFYMMFRRLGKSGDGDQGGTFWTAAAGQTGYHEASFLATASDYYLLIGIEHQGAISINNITIRTDPMHTPHDVRLPELKRVWQSPGRTTYYVDALHGSDGGTGLTPQTAWKTLDRVNTGTFGPGDRILLRCGSKWIGALTPGGNGGASRPIRLASYGAGPKPSIDAQGQFLATLYLHNVEDWDVSDLDIANASPWQQPGLTGVQVRLDDFGTAHDIHLRNLDVHAVNGSDIKDLGGGNGIYCCNYGDHVQSRFDGLLIEGCHLTHTDRNGITMDSAYWHRDTWYPSLHVVIRNNRLDDIGGDGIVPIGCDGARVEGNVLHGARMRAQDYAAGIWPWSCDNTIVQHNEVSGMKGTNDGEGYDSDWNCRNTLFQYNYSHDNDGGFMLICNDGSVKTPINVGNTGTVIRYNVSIHDHDHTFNISGPVRNTKIYNNVFVIGKDAHITVVNGGDWGGDWAEDTQFLNNLIYAEGNPDFNLGAMRRTVFDGNAFWGAFPARPADAHAVTENPLLVSPLGTIVTPRDVRLSPKSPCIGAGVPVSDNGGLDFWGDPVPATGKPDIGAQQL